MPGDHPGQEAHLCHSKAIDFEGRVAKMQELGAGFQAQRLAVSWHLPRKEEFEGQRRGSGAQGIGQTF